MGSPYVCLQPEQVIYKGEDVFISAEKHDTQRCGQLRHPAYVKIKTVNFF